MGGLRAEFIKEAWDNLPEHKKIEVLRGWVLVEVNGKRVKGVILSKGFFEKLEPSTVKELSNRNIKLYHQGDASITDLFLYESPEDVKKKELKMTPEDIAKEMGKELREIKKEDYDSLTPPQRSANNAFTQSLYTFRGTQDFIPESKAIIQGYLAEIRRQKEAKERARRRKLPTRSEVLASFLTKRKGK
jgi:hypothetical protein